MDVLLRIAGGAAILLGLARLARPWPRLKLPTRSQAMLMVGSGLSLVAVSVAVGPAQAPVPARDTSAHIALAMGERGTIAVDLAVLASDEQVLEELAKKGGERGELVVGGRGFLVSFGTLVELIERSPRALRVRVLDGPRAGQAGWVPYEWVRPAGTRDRGG